MEFLLRQILGSCDREVSDDIRSAFAGLASADTELVVAGGDDSVSRFVHDAQVARREVQLHLLGLAGAQMHSRKAAQSQQRCSRHLRRHEVRLNDLIALTRAGVLHLNRRLQLIARL